MEEWKDCDFDCPDCGNQVLVKTKSKKDGHYYDGDDLYCPVCDINGSVICDEYGAYEQWDW